MTHKSQTWRLAGIELSPATACKNSLHSVIERQIVPQLSRAYADQLSNGSTQATQHFTPSAEVVTRFAQLCYQEDDRASWKMLDHLVQERCSIPEILLHLIAPAARYLGEMWDQDRLSFTEVTLALLRMQNMTHHYGFVNRRPYHKAGPKQRVMVAAAPGSQHLLGLAMVSEFFINDGWDAFVELATTEIKLLTTIHSDWFDVLGLSVGLVEQLETLPGLIQSLRSHSINPKMVVLLGGVAFQQVKANENSYGADAVCSDALQAVHMGRLLTERPTQG